MRILTRCISLAVVMVMFSHSLSGQVDEMTLQYWRIRNDLVNDFMTGQGSGAGESCIAYRRVSDTDRLLKYGDNTIKLGIWISTLAMEHRLLTQNGQDLKQTRQALYHAIATINRLDLAAEPYFLDRDSLPGVPSLNGFCLRDDVGMATISVLARLNTRQDIPEVNGVDSDYIKYKDSRLGNRPSQDQMIYLMMGLAFVIRLVPPDVAFVMDDGPVPFSDGETSFNREASLIFDRLKSYMNTDRWNWKLYNPVDGKAIPPAEGGNALALSWGFYQAWQHWTGPHPDFVPASLLWREAFRSYRMRGVYSLVRKGGEGDKILTLAAISDAWGDKTQGSLMKLCMDPEGLYSFPHIPLVHHVLFGTPTGQVAPNSLEQTFYGLIQSLPCYENPYNYGNAEDGFGRSGYGVYEWSANYRVVEPEGRGQSGNAHWYGYFSGLDWLFYHNLFRLSFGMEAGFIKPDIYFGPYANTSGLRVDLSDTLMFVHDFVNSNALVIRSVSESGFLEFTRLCTETSTSFINRDGGMLILEAEPFAHLDILIGEGCRFFLETGSILVVGERVRLHVDPDARVTVQDGAVIKVMEGGKMSGMRE